MKRVKSFAGQPELSPKGANKHFCPPPPYKIGLNNHLGNRQINPWFLTPVQLIMSMTYLSWFITFDTYIFLSLKFSFYKPQFNRQGDSSIVDHSFFNIYSVQRGKPLRPEQLQGLLPRHVLQLGLHLHGVLKNDVHVPLSHLGLVFLVHCHGLFKDGCCLSDWGNQAVVILRSCNKYRYMIIEILYLTIFQVSSKIFSDQNGYIYKTSSAGSTTLGRFKLS